MMKCGWDIVGQPTYNQNLTSSDTFLLSLKNTWVVKIKEQGTSMQNWLSKYAGDLYSTNMRKLLRRLQKRSYEEGDYLKK